MFSALSEGIYQQKILTFQPKHIQTTTYQNHNGNDVIQNILNFNFLSLTKAGLANSDDLVQIIFDAFWGFLFGYFGAESFQVNPNFLSL